MSKQGRENRKRSGPHPKKSLGQHFLISPKIAQKIATLAISDQKIPVLEIGPGTGMLTRALLEAGGHVVAVEKDKELIGQLKNEFEGAIKQGKLRLIEGDALSFEPQTEGLNSGAYTLAANIPYYITGALIKKYIGGETKPRHAILLVQKEVAQRIVAKDGKHSTLSLSVHAYGTPAYKGKVPASKFRPQPSVDSAILEIADISRNFFSNKKEERLFFTIIKRGFAQKRKFLFNNLKDLYSERELKKSFEECEIDPKVRAEDLELPQWKCLIGQLEK